MIQAVAEDRAGVVLKHGKEKRRVMEVEVDNIKMTIRLKNIPAKKQE